MKPKRKYNPKQIFKQKVHKFQMLWEVNEAKRIIELHHLMNGVKIRLAIKKKGFI